MCTVRDTMLLLFVVVVVAAALGNSLDFHFVSDVDTVGVQLRNGHFPSSSGFEPIHLTQNKRRNWNGTDS